MSIKSFLFAALSVCVMNDAYSASASPTGDEELFSDLENSSVEAKKVEAKAAPAKSEEQQTIDDVNELFKDGTLQSTEEAKEADKKKETEAPPASPSPVPVQAEALKASTAPLESENVNPELEYHKIPLLPPISDINWKKWAGPMLEKIYRVRSSDSLWAISERLFGTPYLWPKLWQLNANFSNPHVIKKGIELRFQPGNPNAAPYLAYQKTAEEEIELPLLIADAPPLTLLEKIELLVNTQNTEENPPFRTFVFEDRPDVEMKLPEPPPEKGLLYTDGMTGTMDIEDGSYQAVSIKKSQSGFVFEWKGSFEVSNKVYRVNRVFGQVMGGDFLIKKDFKFPVFDIHQASVPKNAAEDAKIMFVAEGAYLMAADNQFIAAKFSDANEVPPLGAIIPIFRDDREIAHVLVVHRDGRFATLWIVTSTEAVEEGSLLYPTYTMKKSEEKAE